MNVVTCSKDVCERFVLAKHYSRRASIFWAGFSLVEGGNIVGVAVYGQPSPPIQKHAFRDRDFKLYELARVVVQTRTKNAASFLIANSLKLLPSPCAVVSYSDMEQGHCGIIYQATNWLYTGATKSHDKIYIVDGERVHPMTLRDRGIRDPTRWARDNNIEMLPQHDKHRYFQFVGNRREKKAMLAKLNYQIQDAYPKSPRTRYDDGPELTVPYTGGDQQSFDFMSPSR